MSPIAVITVVAAAGAIAVVAVLQGESAGRPSVRDAWAERDAHGDLRLYMTIVNQGGADRVAAIASPVAAEIVVAGGDGALDVPADGATALDAPDHHLVARGVDWEKIPANGFPLVLDFEQADGIVVSVPIGRETE